MKRILSLLVVLALVLSMVPSVFAAAGDESEPIDLTVDLAQEGDFQATVTVPAATTHYFMSYGIAGMEMTINGGEATVCTGNPRTPYSWSITNDGAEAAEYVIAVAYPLGALANPIILEELAWTFTEYSQAAGSEGCYYTYTAPADGVLTLYFSTMPENYVCDIVAYNTTSSVQKSLLQDGVDNYGLELQLDVKANDVLQIQVLAAQDAEGNWYPAADLTWCGNFAYPVGSEQNPVNLEWVWNDAYSEASISVTVPAGQTVYYTGNATMELLVDDVLTAQNEDGIFSLSNTTDADATYALVLKTPVGAYGNPEVVETIPFEDSNSLAADLSYNYIWTAAEDMTLVFDVTDGANVIIDKRTYSEGVEWPVTEQFALAEPITDENYNYTGWDVQDELVIEVTAGQELFISVNALTDWATWTTPAIDYTLTISKPVGSQDNPVDLTNDLVYENDFQATVTIPAGTTWYFMSYGIAGMEMTINDGFAELCAGNPRMPYNWSITNDGTEAAEYVIKVAMPLGSMDNPAQLQVNTSNYSAIAEGSQGYFYTWTAPANGTLELSFSAEDANWNSLGWSYVINNLTSGVYGDLQDSTADPVASPTTLTVSAGEQLQIIVNTLNPETPWAAPAGDLYVTATFVCAEHGSTELEDNYDGTHSIVCSACGAVTGTENHTFVDGVCACNAQIPGTEANPQDLTTDLIFDGDFQATVTVPAGTTYFCQSYNVAGMMMSINGGEATLCEGNPRMPYVWTIVNDGTEEAEYVITVAAPVGTMDNPAALVAGENTAELAEGNQGYFFTYTAEQAGELVIQLPAGNWVYAINNLTTGVYGDTQWSDSDPVMNPATLTVAAGDEISIMVGTYDPASPWVAPAGQITITVTLPSQAPAKEGWIQEDGKWFFYEDGEMVKNAWRKDSKGWVYLGQDGTMVCNKWVKDSKGWCYVGADGYMVYNKWVKDSIGWCYVGADGYMVYNKWVKDSIGWCYVGADGYMVYNKWVKDSIGWCYVGADGYMVYNKWVRDSKGWCYVGSDGYMVTNNWAKDSKGWCFMGADGYIVYNDLILDYGQGKVYYVAADGYMVSNKWIGEGNEWVYFGADGAAVVSGWVKSGGKWYYMDENGLMVYNTAKKIGNKTYFFNSAGVCTNP